ncbi:MAG: ATP synthase F1 subunit delta [Bacteroidales bacterium]|nr:ATP synthase F1 subunit delta [Bacteroidales bacterium]MCF8387457.1 ATP synthase F1 subunit delta [Bacteroidales bacterium]MCF8397457.1 ATP synthase F1 subunit delta [Bacteroidales bacterium]
MKNTIVARRYARALFEFATEQNLLEEVKKDIELLLKVIRENKEFRLMLKSPVIKSEKKKNIMKDIFRDTMHEVTLRYLMIIISKRRESYLDGISDEFIELYKELKNIVTAHFITAVKMDKDIRMQVIDLLKKQTGGEIEFIEEIKEELIGGFVLQYKDKKYDDSIARQLTDLRKDFEVNLYESKL